MAASFIPVDNSKQLGHELLQVASMARDLGERVAAIKAVMDAMANGADNSIIEAQFGLPAGKGSDVAYLMGALKDGLAGVAQFKLLSDWFGQV